MAGHNAPPVIIKRRKNPGGVGHHGGAWKVAYADFVTAMMAFFMLMWLLNATTEKQRKGIADYFDPTISISRTSGGGEDAFSGDSMFAENSMAQNGRGAALPLPLDQGRSRADEQQDEASAGNGALTALERRLAGSGGESMISQQLMRHVVTRQTDEGLIVELHDLPGAALFADGGSEATPVLSKLMVELATAFDLVTNEIAIGGHLAARPVVALGADPWGVSSARADVARRLLTEAGVEPGRVQRVTGFADRKPATKDRMAPRNSRLEVVLLRDQT